MEIERKKATEGTAIDGPSREQSQRPEEAPRIAGIRENIYTLPNALTVSRILASPVLGYAIIQGDFVLATSLLAYAGITDWVSAAFQTLNLSIH